MNKFEKITGGLIAGGILGAVGLSVALSDKGSRKKIMKGSRRMFNDATDAMDDVKSKIW